MAALYISDISVMQVMTSFYSLTEKIDLFELVYTKQYSIMLIFTNTPDAYTQVCVCLCVCVCVCVCVCLYV